MSEQNPRHKDLELIFAQDYHRLYNFAYRMTSSHEDAEDALQNAFIKAYKGIRNFRGDSKLSTWVYRIIVNECHRQVAQIRKLPVTLITEHLGVSEEDFFQNLSYEPTFDDLLIVGEMREQCLYAFIHCMSQKQRIVFLLCTFLELSTKEIAEISEMTDSNVKTTLYRARKKIKDLHAQRCSLIDPSKPCKCHLWIKYMKDRGYDLPKGYETHKVPDLMVAYNSYKQDMVNLYHLYKTEAPMSQVDFIEKMKKILYSL